MTKKHISAPILKLAQLSNKKTTVDCKEATHRNLETKHYKTRKYTTYQLKEAHAIIGT